MAMIEVMENWQTRMRGTNENEYQIYCECSNDGFGNDVTTGKPLLTFDEWLIT